MADEIDTANDLAMLDTEYRIRNASRTKPEATATGFCLLENCGEPVPEGRRWCDADCRDLWERDRKRKPREYLSE